MKRISIFIIISIIIVFISFNIYNDNSKYDLNIETDKIHWSINNKDCLNAVSFDFDFDGNIYIAYKNYIKKINLNNKEEILISNDSLEIYDLVIYNDNLIVASGNRVFKYDLTTGVLTDIVNNIPNLGLNKDIKLLVQNNNLYITIGSNTNSGIVENENGVKDIASFQWQLTGVTYGEMKTGAFAEYGKRYNQEESVKEEKISNASIIEYNMIDGQITTYATGIRNVKGLDFNSEGKIIAIVGGIENTGIRAINGDKDYLYEIKEKAWYGWPDFSGGDPITALRFSKEGKCERFLISNHPTEVVYGPLYQHKTINSLEGLAIDKEGKCLAKDTVIFADNYEKTLYAMNKDGVAKSFIKLSSNSYIKKMKYYGECIYILDSGVGCLYKVKGNISFNVFNLPKVIWIFLIIFVIGLVLVFTIKYKDKSKSI